MYTPPPLPEAPREADLAFRESGNRVIWLSQRSGILEAQETRTTDGRRRGRDISWEGPREGLQGWRLGLRGLVKPKLASCGRAWECSGKGMREGFGIRARIGEEGDRQEEWTLVSYSHQKLAPQSHAFSERLV